MARKAMTVQEAADRPLLWFKHYASAADDIKCQRLVMRRGRDGYGAWWRMCEILASATGHAVPVETDEDWAMLARALFCGPGGDGVAECRGIVADMVDVGLLELRDGTVSSERMLRDALARGAQVAAGCLGGRPSGGSGGTRKGGKGGRVIRFAQD